MACFCDKLREERFSDFTEAESRILRKAYSRAPNLFKGGHPGAAPNAGSVRKARKPSSAPKKRMKALYDSSRSQAQHPGQNDFQTQSFSHTDCVIQITPETDSTSVVALENTYPHRDLEDILQTGDHYSLKPVPPDFIKTVNIILAIEQSEQIIQIKQLSKRIYYYALAKLHPKGTSVDAIVEQVQSVLKHDKNIRSKVYNYLRIGSRWSAIIEWFAFIVYKSVSQKSTAELTGIFCVLGTGTAWERESPEVCKAALASLHAKSDILQRVRKFTPFVNAALGPQISDTYTFIHTPGISNKSNTIMKSASMSRGIHTASSTDSDWKASTLAAASKALPGIHSEGAGLLLVLSCFLARLEIPLLLCVRGATPRKRWTKSGGIEETNTGIATPLVHTLSNDTNLNSALCELQSKSAISSNSNDTWLLDPDVLARVLEALPPFFHSHWRLQALTIASRSVPWKYLERKPLDASKFLAHVRHTVIEVRENEGFQSLAPEMRADLVLTLLEASRFPGIAWKRFAIDQAKEIMHGLNDRYLEFCISQRESLLYRITGDMNRATSAIHNPLPGTCQFPGEILAHAGSGQIAMQRALNLTQIDELAIATDVLDTWQPLSRPPSLIEVATLFRKHIILGKILRYQGRFRESLASLEMSKNLANLQPNLFFDEDRCDLASNLGDALLELERFADAEHHLRTEIASRDEACARAGPLLKLALAEALFAQERHAEAETICSEVQSQTRLLRMEKLRLAVLQAKLSHVKSNWERAFNHWTEAMRIIVQFPLSHGHTTRIILLSICDILRHQGCHELELKSRDQLTTLEKLAGAGGTQYWIAGLRQWLEHLQSPKKSRI
ncbi:hypothetical protein TEQG_07493 [Trichophyton equinum CBS 127.97]|uniref:Uncharacterized protein n=1 Tax=Trichophyton equinum (strain ATCC MYA-4606 / CBS 127.97) TaxID=559882 RepID=F2Q2L5_TRIEC|nr:hypothetical protein TEQG_07493 [Trichophyton equinum CBS 127.97]